MYIFLNNKNNIIYRLEHGDNDRDAAPTICVTVKTANRVHFACGSVT